MRKVAVRLLKNCSSCILNRLQRREYQQREKVLEVLQMADTETSFAKTEKENLVLKMLFGQGRSI